MIALEKFGLIIGLIGLGMSIIFVSGYCVLIIANSETDVAPQKGKSGPSDAETSCGLVCPTTLNCSEWSFCRFHQPDVCGGMVMICEDGVDSKGDGKIKAIVSADSPELANYFMDKTTDSMATTMTIGFFIQFLVVFMIIVMVLLMMVYQSKDCGFLDDSDRIINVHRTLVITVVGNDGENPTVKSVKTLGRQQIAMIKKAVEASEEKIKMGIQDV